MQYHIKIELYFTATVKGPGIRSAQTSPSLEGTRTRKGGTISVQYLFMKLLNWRNY